MLRAKLVAGICLPLVLMLSANSASAATLWVNCEAKEGLTTIGAALKALKNVPVPVPITINVSGACHENVVIQSLDRLTLNAVNGASISDASGGKLDVIDIFDSRDVSINGFTINGGSDGVSGANGIGCGDWSSCRLSGNVIQGAASGAGFNVFQASQATLDGDTLQNNNFGLQVVSGAKVRLGGSGRTITSRNNTRGIDMRRGAFAYLQANLLNNSDAGLAVQFQSTIELTASSISGSGSVGAFARESSFARFTASTITGNAGGGVVYSDLSMGDFAGTTVSSNGGQTDVVCNPQFSATRGTTTIGGTTNCVEP
jgi:hypothetical protein